jgi:hypothetical protein
VIQPLGATSISIVVQIVDDGGLPVTGLTASTFPATIYATEAVGASGTTSITLSNLSGGSPAWSSGGLKERTGGYYRLDLPNGVFGYPGEVKLIGEASGQHLICEPIQVGDVPTVALQSTANTISTATGTLATATALSGVASGVTATNASLGNGTYGLSALQTLIAGLTNNAALANLIVPATMEIPATGSIVYPCFFVVRDELGHLVDLSASPTIAVANGAGTSRAANLSAITHLSTGIYTFTYTVQSSAVEEGLAWQGQGTASSDSTERFSAAISAVVAVDTATAIAAIQSQTSQANQIANAQTAMINQGLTTARTAKLDNLDTNVGSRSTYAGGAADADAANILIQATAAATQTTQAAIKAALTSQGLTGAADADAANILAAAQAAQTQATAAASNTEHLSFTGNLVNAYVSTTISNTNGPGNAATVDSDFELLANAAWTDGITAGAVVTTDWTTAVLSIKANPLTDTDAQALLLVRGTNGGSGMDGVLTLNGAPPTSAAWGSITVSETTPDTIVSWSIQQDAMAIAPTASGACYWWELTIWIGRDQKMPIGRGRVNLSNSNLFAEASP